MSGTIEGTVVFKENNAPLADAAVFLDPEGREVVGTTTDASGKFVFKNVVAGLHNVVVQKKGYKRTREQVTVYSEQTVYPRIEVEKGEPKTKKGKTKGTFTYD